jgi:hypothetical protein
MRHLWTCGALAILLSAPAAAQTPAPRGFVSVNAGIQAAGSDAADHFEFERNVEIATVDVTYPMKAAVLFEGGVGIRIWKRLGVGIAGSRTTLNGSAHVDASIPHPLQFDQPRSVSGDQRAVTRAETAAHLQLLYIVPSSGRWTITLAAGPSMINVDQEIVTDVLYDETFPYDVATFRSATTRRVKASGTGFNAGADLRWMFSRTIGAGALLRFTRADMDLEPAAGRRLAVRAGGVQVGGGLRVVF